MKNRYKGYCKSCGDFVPAESGEYDRGYTWCSEIIPWENHVGYVCEKTWNGLHIGPWKSAALVRSEQWKEREEAIRAVQDQIHSDLLAGGLVKLAEDAKVRSLEQVITKVLGESVSIPDMTFNQSTEVRNELQERIYRKKRSKERQEELKEYKADNRCDRCGGAGQADKWAYTGKVCYKCGGTGKYYKA